MPITMMCRADDEGATFSDYWSNRESSNPGHNPIYLKTTHVGLVLRIGEMNGRDDSDFYAVVWNAEKGEPERIEYASTRGWSYPNQAAPDATPEVLASFAAWESVQRDAYLARRAACVAATPTVGKTVRVVKGRKVPVGQIGEVVWYGKARQFGYPDRYTTPIQSAFRAQWAKEDSNGEREGFRVGLMIDGQRVFTSATNVEVIQSEQGA